ncbi:MAG: SMC-Scp complex subunit ScpB [Candidatus Moraniibacteriota bacterium]
MTEDMLISALEALLFVSGEPLSFARIAKILTVSETRVHELVTALAARYEASEASGLMIVRDGKTVLLATKPSNALLVEALTKSTLQENMSKAALEVLAIIAYRAPIARADIDAIRGVNCSFTLRNLLLRDLITREGNPSDSRGYLYRPTLKLLQTIGIEQISELPDYETLVKDERLHTILEQDETVLSEESVDDTDTKK